MLIFLEYLNLQRFDKQINILNKNKGYELLGRSLTFLELPLCFYFEPLLSVNSSQFLLVCYSSRKEAT